MCDCLEKLNAQLAEHNSRVDTVLDVMCNRASPHIVTSLIEKRRGQRAPVMLATFCPWCGKRYEPKSKERPSCR